MSRLAALALLLLIAVPLAALAQEAALPQEESPSSPQTALGELQTQWSATFIGQVTHTDAPDDDDDVGGFFDQYEFIPNKSSSFPFQIGIREGSFDLFTADDAPLVRARVRSPTSNLGVSGSQADEAFFNQTIDTLLRLDGIDVDFRYRRIRTEQLRIFPNTFGPGLAFDDRSDPDDRFDRERTGFLAEIRARPYEALGTTGAPGSWLAPELSLRGGYDSRDSLTQIRLHRGSATEWAGATIDRDRSVGSLGGGLLVAPQDLLTLTLDFDHERLNYDTPLLTDGDFGDPPPDNTLTTGFAPSTDRSTATLRFNSRLGERAVIEGGFQFSQLEQVDDYTPDQRTFDLDDNKVRTYGANAAFDAELARSLSINGFFKFDRRENHIDRDTELFSESNGTQVGPLVKHWQRFLAGTELELRAPGSTRGSLGVRYEDITRKLDFALPGSARIFPDNALIENDTQIVTLYGRASSRPWRRLRVHSELGYRWAPETGYATDLDDNVYGEVRLSYAFQLSRPLSLSAYLRGSEGENDNVVMIDGLGPEPAGTRLRRKYERSNVVTGITASGSPIDRLDLFASLFYSRDERDISLDLSDLPRYWQERIPFGYRRDGTMRFENEQTSLVLGGHYAFGDQTDGGVSYAFTRSHARYDDSSGTARLDDLADNREIESEVHVLDLEIGHWLKPGLRVLVGYRYQHHDDDGPEIESMGSAVDARDFSADQHTVTLGITLTSDLLAGSSEFSR